MPTVSAGEAGLAAGLSKKPGATLGTWGAAGSGQMGDGPERIND
jgi:hypothetical protein